MNEMLNPREMAGLGHNQPPASLIDDLTIRYKELLDQFAELMDAAQQAPDKIENDIIHAKVIELIKKMRVLEKQADATRDIEREPFSQKVAEVNGFFKSRIDPMKALRTKLNERHEAYSQAKAAAEKRRLEEEAERRRVAEQEALNRAAEAERKKREAEAAQAKAEAEARAAEEARARAAQERADAEARAAKAKADEIRLAAERKERERLAEIAAAAKAEQDEADRIAQAERKRIDDEAAAAARALRLEEEEKARVANEAAKKARTEQLAAEEQARVAKGEAKVAGRDEKASLGEALREDKRASRIEQVAEGPDAALARSRSEHGAVGTLSRKWTCRIVDRDKLDKAALWSHINGEALEAALWKWMMAQEKHKRVMAGAVMEEETIGQVR